MLARHLRQFPSSLLLQRLACVTVIPPPSPSSSSSLLSTSATRGGSEEGGRGEEGGGGEGGVLGIRREESSVWERRAPLSPNHVQSLVSRGVQVSLGDG